MTRALIRVHSHDVGIAWVRPRCPAGVPVFEGRVFVLEGADPRPRGQAPHGLPCASADFRVDVTLKYIGPK